MKNPPSFSFARLVRTNSSESHVIRRPSGNPDSTDNIGSIDLHFEGNLVHGTLVLKSPLSEAELESLIDQMTDQLVPTQRDDFIFTAYSGTEIGYYSDSVSEGDRSYHSATKGDVEDIRRSLARVIGSHQNARGKVAEHAAVAYFQSIGYSAVRAGVELDALKIDVVASNDTEVVYVQSKLGAIAASEMRKVVRSVSTLPPVECKQAVVAIVARTFPRDSEYQRRKLEQEFGLPVMCVQSYQLAAASPEYRHALGE
jgi:Holliday junction resolvase-like predicted endonuclease